MIYELHVGTFTPAGTFAAAIERLDHLVDARHHARRADAGAGVLRRRAAGATTASISTRRITPTAGPSGLKTLVDACHARGLAVLLDVVYNHLGPAGNYLAEFGAVLHRSLRARRGVRRSISTGPAATRCAASSCDNALMWLRDYHFDGLRIDAVHALIDLSAVHFLEQLAIEVERLGSRARPPRWC